MTLHMQSLNDKCLQCYKLSTDGSTGVAEYLSCSVALLCHFIGWEARDLCCYCLEVEACSKYPISVL